MQQEEGVKESAEARRLFDILLAETDPEKARATFAQSCVPWALAPSLVQDVMMIALRELHLARKHAHTDHLTELPNRRYAIHHWNRNRGNGGQAFLLIDLDDFKQVNDTYGHGVGDVVLTNIADCLCEAVRPGDVMTSMISRHGGEEFLVILSGVNEEGVVVIAERIRSTVAQHEILIEGVESPLRMTVSIGVHFATSSENLEEAIKEADDALYRAKDSGKNRVCVSG